MLFFLATFIFFSSARLQRHATKTFEFLRSKDKPAHTRIPMENLERLYSLRALAAILPSDTIGSSAFRQTLRESSPLRRSRSNFRLSRPEPRLLILLLSFFFPLRTVNSTELEFLLPFGIPRQCRIHLVSRRRRFSTVLRMYIYRGYKCVYTAAGVCTYAYAGRTPHSGSRTSYESLNEAGADFGRARNTG